MHGLTQDERDDLFRSQRWDVRDAAWEGTKVVTVRATWRGLPLDWNYIIDLGQVERLAYSEAALEEYLVNMQDEILYLATERKQMQ